MRGFRRPDGRYEIDGRIVDAKPVTFETFASEKVIRAGEPLHDMCVRLVIDVDMHVHGAIAASDATPFRICPGAAAAVPELVGARIAAGWRMEVMRRIGGVRGCAHIIELITAMGAAAFQSMSEERRARPEPRNSHGVPLRVDSCFGYAADGEIVARVWPQHAIARRQPDSKN